MNGCDYVRLKFQDFMINNVVTALCKNMKCACVKCVKTLNLEPYIVTTVMNSLCAIMNNRLVEYVEMSNLINH